MPRTNAQEFLSCLGDSEAASPDRISSEQDDRAATPFSLRRFFQPRSVAVVGASRDPASIGRRLFDAIIQNGFRGPVFPVNAKAAVIGGERAYPSLRELPEYVDRPSSWFRARRS
jgi:hypothetical protein